jgi:hypothetical protein
VTDAVPFHFGFAVADRDEATAIHGRIGVREWVLSEWRTTRYFDAGCGGIVEPRTRVAYGRLTDEIALEFLEVDRSGAVPLVWRLAEGGVGLGHLGHWVEETRPVAQRMLREGGRIVMARANSPAVEALTVADAGNPDAVPEALDTCYVLTAAGQLIELVPARIWSGRLVDTFSPRTQSVIPKPPSHLFIPAG